MDDIEAAARRGEPILHHFTSMGMRNRTGAETVPVRLTLDPAMLGRLDRMAAEIGIDPESLLKLLVQQGLDHHFGSQVEEG